MTVQLLVSRFAFMMAVQSGYNLVTLQGDEVGVYCRGYRNKFGTSLVARGPRANVETLLTEVGASKKKEN